jgi:hypothetical protein
MRAGVRLQLRKLFIDGDTSLDAAMVAYTVDRNEQRELVG